ncbi:hypothetical protein [Bartonella heixiaziensis]|uniref:hypothetical protein n=1 Tax=Bartonella heixiaziensis TaxID=1461000 RepID=UPI003D1A4F11
MEQQYVLGKYTRALVYEEVAIFGADSKQFVINEKKDWENFDFSPHNGSRKRRCKRLTLRYHPSC